MYEILFLFLVWAGSTGICVFWSIMSGLSFFLTYQRKPKIADIQLSPFEITLNVRDTTGIDLFGIFFWPIGISIFLIFFFLESSFKFLYKRTLEYEEKQLNQMHQKQKEELQKLDQLMEDLKKDSRRGNKTLQEELKIEELELQIIQEEMERSEKRKRELEKEMRKIRRGESRFNSYSDAESNRENLQEEKETKMKFAPYPADPLL